MGMPISVGRSDPSRYQPRSHPFSRAPAGCARIRNQSPCPKNLRMFADHYTQRSHTGYSESWFNTSARTFCQTSNVRSQIHQA